MDKKLSSAILKIMAVISMTIDHIGAVLIYPEFVNACMVNGLILSNNMIPEEAKPIYLIYIATRIAGRIAFPIFAFLIAEGAYKTKNIKKYFSRLMVFALLSEIPYDMAVNGCLYDMRSQNIFFTLAAGLLVIILIKNKNESNRLKTVLLTVALCTLSVFLSFSIGGIMLIVFFYMFRYDRKRLIFAVLLSTMLMTLSSTYIQLFSVLAYPLIYLYNGKRGGGNKYIFYAYYPLHLLILYLLT